MIRSSLVLSGLLLIGGAVAHAQEAVVAVPDIEKAFTSPDPQLNANKQVAYKIMRDLLEANHWDKASDYLTKRYLQHNPNAKSGLDGVVYYFTQVAKRQATPIPDKLHTKVAFVMAEGDLVTVATVREMKDAKGETYTTTWFDTWRFKDGKADEHWDGATRQ